MTASKSSGLVSSERPCRARPAEFTTMSKTLDLARSPSCSRSDWSRVSPSADQPLSPRALDGIIKTLPAARGAHHMRAGTGKRGRAAKSDAGGRPGYKRVFSREVE